MIDALKVDVPVRFLCRHFGVSPSGFYKWQSCLVSQREVRKENVCRRINEIFVTSKKTYGSPRIYQDLLAEGFRISENTVAKYMREMGLDARLKKRFRVLTTDSNHSGPIAERVFKAEDELPTGPSEVLAGDITYLRLGSTFIYLAVVIDLFNREVVGWSMSRSLRSDLVVDALKMALANCHSQTQIVFHSDRGSQYASDVFLELLKNKQVIPSMSRKGNCYDNCYVESWFKSLKTEYIYRNNYQTENQLRALVFEYIETWYNPRRRHSSLGYLSPLEYKSKHAAA